jgi:tRNA(adenine34) deaminase
MHAAVAPERFMGADALEVSLMRLALAEARKASLLGEVPIGAVVAYEGKVVARAHNAPRRLHDPTAHAEILALREAAQLVGNYRLPGASVYVTAEPCVMCVGALLQARVAHLVFGCSEPKSGALGSVFDIGRDGSGPGRLQVRGGVCAEAAATLLREFFQVRRGA